MIKAVMFDMDGVLVDTEWFYNRRRCAYLETKGFVFDEIPDLSGTNDIYVWEYFEPDDAQRRAELKREYVEQYMPAHPVPYDELKNKDAKPVMEALRERGVVSAIASSGQPEYVEQYMPAHPVPYDELKNKDAKPVMEALRERGVVSAIASSGQPEMIEELVEAADLRDVLVATVSGHEVAAFKPDPAVYLRTMELLGVTPEECLVVEDSPLGIEAGRRAGCRTLALRPREGVSLDQSKADRIIDSLWDLLEEIAE